MAAGAQEQASDLEVGRKYRDEDGNDKEVNRDVLQNDDVRAVGKEKIDVKEEENVEAKPSRLKILWGNLGLDIGTVMMMFKSVSFFFGYLFIFCATS
jgi:hypothetical protein